MHVDYVLEIDSTGQIDWHAKTVKNSFDEIAKIYSRDKFFGKMIPSGKYAFSSTTLGDRMRLKCYDESGSPVFDAAMNGGEFFFHSYLDSGFNVYEKSAPHERKFTIIDSVYKIPDDCLVKSDPADGLSFYEILESAIGNPESQFAAEYAGDSYVATFKRALNSDCSISYEYVFTKKEGMFLPKSFTATYLWKIDGEYKRSDNPVFSIEFGDYKRIGGLVSFFPEEIKVARYCTDDLSTPEKEKKAPSFRVADAYKYAVKNVSYPDNIDDLFKIVLPKGTKVRAKDGGVEKTFIVGDPLLDAES